MGEGLSTELVQSRELLKFYKDLQTANMNRIVDKVVKLPFPVNGELRNNEMCFYRVSQLSYDEDYPHREAFENVLLSLDNEAYNFVYVLTGTETGIELHIGVVENQNENVSILGKKLSAVNYGEIVASVFEGNFSGSKLEKVKARELGKLVGSDVGNYKNAGVLFGIPSINGKENGEDYDFQGIDRLINSMLGLEWRLVIVCEPVSKKELLEMREDIYELYNRLSVCAKKSYQESSNDATTITFGSNTSTSESKSVNYSKNDSKSSGKQNEHSNSSSQHSEGISKGDSRGSTKGKNQGYSLNTGRSSSVTVEMANKHAQELMKYIDEELIERIKIGYSKGIFKTSIYYMAEEPTHANRLKVGLMSLFQGNKSTFSPLCASSIDISVNENSKVLTTYQNQYIEKKGMADDVLLLLGRPFNDKYMGINSYLTTSEISLIAGLPQKEVPGLALKENVAFGLNEKKLEIDKAINLGCLVQRGRKLKSIPFYLSRECMSKHTFVAGVTGSGKTTTCHRLLSEAQVPYLVIEPAKTEYRTLINSDNEIVVFTLGDEMTAPFRLNPFELIKGEVISAHVDMIKATFTSAFPMEASMPQILEEAIYKCYEKKGWNIDTNINEILGDKAYEKGTDAYPILSDLLVAMEEVVETKNFGNELSANYKGSLISRLSNLTVGSKGRMLNCSLSTDFRYLAHNKVVLEMEELKSPEDKALIMGFVLTRLSAVIKDEHRKDSSYKHLTLIEEAHRLLSKVEYGDSGSKKGAVETFTDLLAEVRKYGEGLIIVDQIPNKLASEVLKNTNTKIIHKILARDDKEAVGDTMLMDDKQKEHLSALEVGNAIVFSEHTEKPMHVHISAVSNTNEKQIDNQVVKERFVAKREVIGGSYEDLDVAEIYPLFKEIVEKMKGFEINKDEKDKLTSYIKKICLGNETEERKMWDMLIMRREKERKGEVGRKQLSVSREELINFFIETFSGEKITRDYLYERRKIINSLYLV